MFCKRSGARAHRLFSSLEPPPRLAYVRRPLQKTDGPWGRECTWLRARSELCSCFGAAKAVPTAPPTNTLQILQTTDENDDFVDGIIGGAIVLGMILIIYACHSCYIRFCRNRRENAGAILNLPNMVQLPSKFPIGSPFLHKDDGITRGVARIFQRGGHRRYSPDYIWFIPLLSLVYQRAQSYYRGMKAHIN